MSGTYFYCVCLLFFKLIYTNAVYTDQILCKVNCSHLSNISEINNDVNLCMEKCGNSTDEITHEAIVQSQRGQYSLPELYCRTESTLTVAWKPWQPFTTESPFLYLLELRSIHSPWNLVQTTFNNNITFENLTSENEYEIRLWALDQKMSKVLGPTLLLPVRTLPEVFDPLPVPKIVMKKLELNNDRFQATIEWTPNEVDRLCYYELVYFGYNGADYLQIEYKHLASPFEIEIKELEFDSNYSVEIMAKNGNWERESIKTMTHFTTPTCLEVHADLNVCAPPQPNGLTSTEIVAKIVPDENGHTIYYDITVSWKIPELQPDYYIVILFSLVSPTNSIKLNITGAENSAVFKNVDVGLHYQVTVIAFSSGGRSESAILHRQITTHSPFTTQSKHMWLLIIIGLTTLCLLAVFGGGFYLYHRRAKRKRYERRCKYFEELEEKTPKNIDCITTDTSLILDDTHRESDKWEILNQRLVLQSVLGEGAFGLVRRAWLRDEKGNANTEVAVKMLKESPSPEQVRHFLHEIEIMKTAGQHPNLVSLIGCCTRSHSGKLGNGGMMLVVEYCALGDLYNYLHNAWDHMTSLPEQQNIQYADLVSPANSEGSTNLIINKLYDLDANGQDEFNIKPNDLISFARQIAVGMEYLASMKVLHRDLAARNVLVCADKTVKVADFGLSRDVYKDNIYQKSGNGKLPIRWMALESLTHQIYTSQSDVWSFGILLWEIVTLGGNPYPNIPTNTLIKLLRSGYRMERPSNCGFELYSLMLSCWKVRPKDRPNFTELRKSLDMLLESITTSKYLDLDVLSSTEFASFRIPVKDSTTITLKNKNKCSESICSDRYVHPVLLNNSKNSLCNTDYSMIIK